MNKLEFLGVAVILMKNGKVALCQRLAQNRPFYLKWGFAGGGVEDNELHWPALTAIRETEEETGISLNVYQLEYIGHTRADGDCVGGCLFYVARLTDNQEPVNTEPHKHTDWEWCDYDTATRKDLIPRIHPILKKLYGV